MSCQGKDKHNGFVFSFVGMLGTLCKPKPFLNLSFYCVCNQNCMWKKMSIVVSSPKYEDHLIMKTHHLLKIRLPATSIKCTLHHHSAAYSLVGRRAFPARLPTRTVFLTPPHPSNLATLSTTRRGVSSHLCFPVQVCSLQMFSFLSRSKRAFLLCG